MHGLIETLRSEHDDARLAVEVLAAMASRIEGGALFPVDDCALVLRYLREFMLGVHFNKEAQSLLEGIAMHGSHQDLELAGAVLRSQDDARTLLNSLVLFWEPRGDLTPAERSGFATATRSLSQLLHRSMDLEERRLFSAACRVPADDRLEWPTICAAIDRSHRSAREWRRDLQDLGRRWLD